MPGWNGSGTFVRTYNWANDAAANIDIEASRMDTEDDGFATGLENCLTRDGQNSPSADINWGGYKITSMGNATTRTGAAALGQIQDSSGVYVVTTGSSNAYVAAPSPAITTYTAGHRILIKANFTNTSAATIAVSGLAAKDIKKSGNVALAANDIFSGQIVELVYDGTNYQIVSQHIPVNIDLAGTLDVTGNTTLDANLTVAGSATAKPTTVAVTGTTKTLTIGDSNTVQWCSNASAQTITIPTNASVAFLTDTVIAFVQEGAGAVTIVGATGVTVNGTSAGSVQITAQYRSAVATKRGTNTWVISGQVA